MRVSQHLLSRQNRPTKPGNAVNSSITRLRAGRNLSGAFLFAAFIAFVIYGTAPADQSGNTQAASGKAASTLHLQAVTAAPNNEQNSSSTTQSSTDDNNDSDGSGSSSNISTNVTTDNGSTNVTVNGQSVPADSDGSINKTITTDNGTVQINVSQQSNGTNSSSTNLNYNSNSYSDDWSNNAEENMNFGN